VRTIDLYQVRMRVDPGSHGQPTAWIATYGDVGLDGLCSFVATTEEDALQGLLCYLRTQHGFVPPPDDLRGRYLCETCWEAMTDRVVMLDGLEQSQCEACAYAQ
jgi:hypothetical protein